MTSHLLPLDSLLLDFSLAFVFFVALLYTVLKPRFGGHRAVVAMAVTIGLALSVGLVWWERDHGWSVRDLGPFALILVLLLLAAVLWRSSRSHRAVGIAAIVVLVLAAAVWYAPLAGPDAVALIQTVLGTAVLLGILAFLWHLEGRGARRAAAPRALRASLPRRRAEVDRDRRVGAWIGQSLERARRLAKSPDHNPQERGDVLLQIRRMLPAEGWLTERMAKLREQAHLVRHGHIARLKEVREAFRQMPIPERKKASEQLIARYRALIGIDTRLERLDHAVAACEKRIREVTKEAERAVARNDFPRVHKLLEYAGALQKHNSTLFKKIDQAEGVFGELIREVVERTDAQ